MKIKVRVSGQENRFSFRKENKNEKRLFEPSMRDIQTITRTVGEPFDGVYEYTPKFEDQTLKTAKKYLAEDLIIKAIPVSKVSNLSGGNTIYIGAN